MSRVLVDTHALLWWLADDRSLSARARELIGDPATEALVSVVSLWEIAIKRGLGKLRVPETLPETITAEGFEWLPVEAAHAWDVGSLTAHHRDPFDRLLIAQAIGESIPIITADPHFAPYDVEVCW